MSAEVEVHDKTFLAYNLKLAGCTLSEIADRLNFKSANAVSTAIKRHVMAEARGIDNQERESIRQMEIARLDYMQTRIWPQIDHGDLKAVETGLKIIALRSKLSGLDQVDASSSQTTVLVVGGQEEEYVNKLKALAEGS